MSDTVTMEQPLGIEQLLKIVDAAGEAVNVGEKILTGGGVLNLLALSDEVAGLASLDTKAVTQEIKDVSTEEGAQLTARFKSKVVLKNKDLEAKIEAGPDGLAEAVSVVIDGVKVFNHAKAVAEKFHAMFVSIGGGYEKRDV